jgi:hypothetical protein
LDELRWRYGVTRSLIVNCARERIAQKRGGDWRPPMLSTELAVNVDEDEGIILRVYEALEALE